MITIIAGTKDLDELAWEMKPVPAMLRDPSLEHQVVLLYKGFEIMISCNCLRRKTTGGNYASKGLGLKTRWEAHEIRALWRAHMREVRRNDGTES